jgi:hypothetical protein
VSDSFDISIRVKVPERLPLSPEQVEAVRNLIARCRGDLEAGLEQICGVEPGGWLNDGVRST